MTYTQHRDTQGASGELCRTTLYVICLETLAVIEGLELDSDPLTEEEVAKKFGWEEDFLNGRLSRWQSLKPKIW